MTSRQPFVGLRGTMFESALQDILSTKNQSSGCGFAQWINSLDEPDQVRIDALLAHPDVSATDIHEVVSQHFRLSITAVRRHRRYFRLGTGDCGCR